jgi:hypothetical protein
MFRQVRVPLLGLVDNMASFACPKCGHEEAIFGAGGVQRAAEEMGLDVLGQVGEGAAAGKELAWRCRGEPRERQEASGMTRCSNKRCPGQYPCPSSPPPPPKTLGFPQIPLDMAVRVQCDEGVPIVVSHPDSPSAQAYASIAARVWEKLQAREAAQAGGAGGGGPKITIG